MPSHPSNASELQINPRQLSILRNSRSGATGLQRGIEKESLRVTPQGELSHQPHPKSLGSALTHPHITTDFSEAQLELITAVHKDVDGCLTQLRDVHRYVYAGIADELLWPSSMPCLVGTDDDIPIGRYGTSNIGQAKSVYRHGLGVRYGRLMQTISGIHYNFSLPDALWSALGFTDQSQITDAYFGLIRNFRRWSWLLLYLFGASPTVCKSFTKHLDHNLLDLDEGSQYLPHATSLRMGPLGYQSSAQSQLNISYNSLDQYAESMCAALTTEFPAYAAKGVLVDGEYQQLNTAILQIENEFYGTIRPKRPVRSGERPVNALRDRGVEYVEVRCMDLNPYLPIGIDSDTVRFLDTFLLSCLLSPSPPDDPAEIERLQSNQLQVVQRGREPGIKLQEDTSSAISLDDWARALIGLCGDVAAALDEAHDGNDFTRSIINQTAKLDNPNLTPSAQVLKDMHEQGLPFFRFSMNQAKAHATTLQQDPLTASQQHEMRRQAEASFDRQRDIEAADTQPFAAFLEEYLAI